MHENKMTDTPDGEMTRTLTLAQLEAKGACSKAVARFRELFGESVDVTVALAEAHAADFDLNWAGSHLLTAPAWDKYERATAPAWDKYERATAAAWAKCERVTAAAWASAWAEYERVRAAARSEYERVRAPAWARLYIEEGAE